MSESPKQFIKRFIAFSLGPIISACISFITVPITTHFVIPEELGKAAMYTMALSISSLFIFLGMDQAFTREYNTQGDKKSLFWNSLIVPLIFSFFIGTIYVIFYKTISIWMFESLEKHVMIMLAVSLPFSIIDRFNLLLIRMQERARVYSILNVASKLANVIVLIPYVLYIDKSFKGIINANFFSLIVMCIVECFFVKNFWLSKFKINKDLIHKMLCYGFPLVPATIVSSLLNSMDKMAMRYWSTLHEIGLYEAAFKVVAVVAIVQQAFCTFWIPTAFRWYEENVENEKYISISNMLMCFMSFIFIFIVLFRDLIIKILSPNYANASAIVPFLLFYPIMYTVSEATTLGISFSKKTYYNILVSIIATGINYILNYMFVPKYGAIGASVATGVSYMVFFWVRTLISRKLWFKFNLSFYILNTLFMIIFASLDVLYHNTFINIIMSLAILFINRKEIMIIVNYGKTFLREKSFA